MSKRMFLVREGIPDSMGRYYPTLKEAFNGKRAIPPRDSDGNRKA